MAEVTDRRRSVDVRRCRAEGQKHGGQLGNQHAWRADGAGDLGSEERAAAAVAEDGVRARVKAERGQPAPHRFDHAGQRQLAYAPRRLLGVQAQLGPRRAHAACAASGSSAKSPPKKRVGSMYPSTTSASVTVA